MSDKSNIEWTDSTWNPIVGCSKVSPGCANCYAETMAGRLAAMNQRAYQDVVNAPDLRYGPRSTWNGTTRLVESALAIPLRWKKPRKIFVCSMSDLFHENTPFEWVDKVFAVMALCPQHAFQVLTKRPERMREYLQTRTSMDASARYGRAPQWYQKLTDWLDEGAGGFLGNGGAWDRCHAAAEMLHLEQPLPNVWLGTTAEDQQRYDERIKYLLACPAAVRFLSLEPLLGAIDLKLRHAALTDIMDADPKREPRLRGSYPFSGCGLDDHAITRRHHMLHQIIAGGESGPKARPSHPDWFRSLRDQCAAAGVPFLFKQWGEWGPSCNHGFGDDGVRGKAQVTLAPYLMYRVGKKLAGRLLDGVEHNAFPESPL
jgi:protein gp37